MMKRRNIQITALIAALMLTLLLSACGGSEVNSHVAAVVDAMCNAPNDDYYDPLAYVVLGEDTRTEEQKAEAEKAAERVNANWEKLCEENFAPSNQKTLLNSGTAMVFQALTYPDPGSGDDARLASIEVKSVELKEEDKDLGYQTVTVTLTVNGESEYSFDVEFSIDKDGLIDKAPEIAPEVIDGLTALGKQK